MLPSRIHSRHPTWPPTSQLLPGSTASKEYNPRSLLKPEHNYIIKLPEISDDEDPFSHFLSPVLEEESSLAEVNYTAGITPYVSDPGLRKDALFRARLEEKWETFVARRLLQHAKSGASSIPAPLPPPFPQTPSTPPEEDALPDLLDESMDSDILTTPDGSPRSPSQIQWHFPDTIDAEDSMDDFSSDDDMVDGWAGDRRRSAIKSRQRQAQQQLSPRSRKFRSSERTMSGKKHAWRVPSIDLWTVEEEMEEEISVGEERRGRKGRKRAKTVHWNEEVEVLEYER